MMDNHIQELVEILITYIGYMMTELKRKSRNMNIEMFINKGGMIKRNLEEMDV